MDEFFKRAPKFDEKEASVTGNTEEQKNTAKKLQMMLILIHRTLKELLKRRKKWLQYKNRAILCNFRENEFIY